MLTPDAMAKDMAEVSDNHTGDRDDTIDINSDTSGMSVAEDGDHTDDSEDLEDSDATASDQDMEDINSEEMDDRARSWLYISSRKTPKVSHHPL